MENNLISEEFMNTIWTFYETNLTPRTRKEYFNVLKNYVKITGNDPLHLTQKSTDVYYQDIDTRLKNDQLSYTTALMRISVMRSICEFIRYHQNSRGIDYTNYFADIILTDVDKTIKNENLPTESELNYLLEMAEKEKDETAFLLFSFVMKCGLTASEICTLKAEQFEIDGNDCLYIRFPQKNRPARTIKLPQDISDIMKDYIEKRQIIDGPVFLNKRKNSLKLRDAERILVRYLTKGIEEQKIAKKFTLQMMRHAAFKYMLQGGATESQVAQYGGITTKWMTRYRQVSVTELTSDATDFSILSIKRSK